MSGAVRLRGRAGKIARQYRVSPWKARRGRGPGWAVERLAAQLQGPESAAWVLLAAHLRTVWESQRAATVQGGRRGVDLEFAVRVSRHALRCRACSSDPGLELWAVAYRWLGVEDVVRHLR